jgi:hypothetical protein
MTLKLEAVLHGPVTGGRAVSVSALGTDAVSDDSEEAVVDGCEELKVVKVALK